MPQLTASVTTETAQDEPVVTAEEAGRRLNVHQETIRRYWRQGHLDGYTLPGGRLWIFERSINELIERGRRNRPVIQRKGH